MQKRKKMHPNDIGSKHWNLLNYHPQIIWGETCKSDADCYSQACDSHNYCQDKKINENCSNDKQCCKECVYIFDPLNGESDNDKTCRV